MLALVMALCAVSFTVEAAPAKTAAIKITQATREGATKAFFKAVFVNKDFNAAWNLMSPDFKAKYIKKHGSEAKAKVAFKKFINKFIRSLGKSTIIIKATSIDITKPIYKTINLWSVYFFYHFQHLLLLNKTLSYRSVLHTQAYP